MKQKYSCGIDIGSSKVALTLIKAIRNQKEIIFNDFQEHDFIKDDFIVDFPAARDTLKKLVDKAFKRIPNRKCKILSNIEGAAVLEAQHLNARMPLNEGRGKIVGSGDLKKLYHYARGLASEIDKEIIDQIPLSYSADSKVRSTENIVGLFARKIQADFLILRANSSHLNNIYQLIHSVGLGLDGLVFSGSALKVLFLQDNHSQQNLYVVADIAASHSSLTFCKGSDLVDVVYLASGTNSLVSKVSKELKISSTLASDILKSYGSAIAADISDSENLVIKKAQEYQTLKRKELILSLEPAVKELLNEIKEKIMENKLCRSQSPEKIIATGRICSMDGFLELAEKITGIHTEFGTNNALELPVQKTPCFAVSTGLALCGLDQGRLKFAIEAPNKVIGFLRRLKEVYEDYF